MTSSSIREYVESHIDRLVGITRDLIRIPSENNAPEGNEIGCQEYVARFLRECGHDPVMYTPDEAPGIRSHPLWWPGRNYNNRPNVAARWAGSGGGRSLVLSGHVDTVPAGSEPWTRDPFGGEVEGDRIYGRGSNDMKAGVATNLFVVQALAAMGIRLAGDLTIETVVDEEFGGVNGTLAGRLMGFNGDAAVISEPSFLRVCPAQRGGRTADFLLSSCNEGILGGSSQRGVVEQLRELLERVDAFRRLRRSRAKVHPLYTHLDDPVPVTVTRIFTAPWGTSEPTNVPSTCRVALFWQAMPGETVEDIDREFFEHFEGYTVAFPIRWLPGSAIDADSELVRAFGNGRKIQGIEGPCDMYVFHEFGIPAVLWGARGGNTHNPDEYVEIDSLVEAATGLLEFICRWCGKA